MALEHSVILVVGLTILLLTEPAPGPNPFRERGRSAEVICLVVIVVGFGVWGLLHVGDLP
jgi:hypothetical protein